MGEDLAQVGTFAFSLLPNLVWSEQAESRSTDHTTDYLQNATQEAYLDEFYRGRLRALQPVDELVEDVVNQLQAAGQLDNTYIFYTCAWV